jgi:hypothetical protein
MDNSNYLAHHGVKGQEWGKRRWQYADGSLTPAGREHYGYGEARKSSVTSDTKTQIKIMREKARAERAMVKEQARADRAMYREKKRVELAETKYQDKLNAKIEKAKRRDQLKLEKLKQAGKDRKSLEYAKRKEEQEKQKAIELANQRKMIAQFKKDHPLKYKQLKPYLKADGTLNDAGQALFFGNGEKKKISQMSNEDLKKTTDRLYLEKNYKQAVYELKKQDSNTGKAKAARIAMNAGMTFAGAMAANSIESIVQKGGIEGAKADLVENGKDALSSALNAAGIIATKEFGLVNDKGNQKYNAFKVDFETEEQKIARQAQEDARKAVSNMMRNEMKENLVDTWKESSGYNKRLNERIAKETDKKTKEKLEKNRKDYVNRRTGEIVKKQREKDAKRYAELSKQLYSNTKLSDDKVKSIQNELDKIMDREPNLYYWMDKLDVKIDKKS